MSQDEKSAGAVVTVLATHDENASWSRITFELLGDAAALAKRWNGRVGCWVLERPTGTFDGLAAHGCEAVYHLRNPRLSAWSSEAIAAALSSNVPFGSR